MTESNESTERRARQRFLAKRRGEHCFWAVIGGVRVALLDLSLEGFAMPAEVSPAGGSFEFVLQRAGVPDEIRGRAQVVNRVGGPEGGQAGCLFDAIEGDGRERLAEWLTAHVLVNASVPITEKDAVAIVSGPSLI
jgi:hypothetical protein